MGLVFLHPGVAAIRCADCRRWIYDFETGKRKTYRAGPTREEKPCVRPVSVKTPCETCPKGSPDRESQFQLSPKNQRTLEQFLEWRHAGGLADGACDRLTRRNFAIVGELYEEWLRRQNAEAIGCQVALLLTRR